MQKMPLFLRVILVYVLGMELGQKTVVFSEQTVEALEIILTDPTVI